jgi:N-acetylglucosamine kinase-like BadF-type ATPase
VTLLAGVDAGASHTEAVITGASLETLSRHRGDPGNVSPERVSVAAAAIAATVRGALERSGCDEALAMLVVGAAGAGRPTERTALQDALTATAVAATVHVTTDAAIAMESAFSNGPGIILMAGTGSIAHGTDGAGGQWRVGGLGWRVGDEGSAFALGRAGIGAALRGLDGRTQATTLERAIPQAIGVTGLEEIRDWAAQAETSVVAELARTVCDQAEAGDEVAVSLVREAGEALAAHVTALLRHFPPASPVPVALGGGLLVSHSAVRNALLTTLALQAPRADVLDIEIDPPLGAIRLAAQITAAA